jgi:hypothetical protein
VPNRPFLPIAGSTALPAGFAHPHASEEARQIAEDGMILRVQVGSGVHGTSISGQDDRDEMGLCLEPPQFVTGLARVPNGIRGLGPSVRFEQYERHTAWDKPGGLANRSGAGDLDVIIYSAHTNRPELVAVHGYDTKHAMHAMHALRLGLQGVELLTTGRITLPVPQPHRAYLRSIRRGERPLAEVLDAVTDAEARLCDLRDSPAIPQQPDRRWVDDWLHRSYLSFWETRPAAESEGLVVGGHPQ